MAAMKKTSRVKTMNSPMYKADKYAGNKTNRSGTKATMSGQKMPKKMKK